MVQGRWPGFQDPKDRHRRLLYWYVLAIEQPLLGRDIIRTRADSSPIDKKCPFTGMVSIRGRILTGTVVSTKMHRTVIIRREYLHYIPKYSRYEKRHKNLAAHVSPAFRVEEGDQVTVGQCRPLSKTVRTPQTIKESWKTQIADLMMRVDKVQCPTGSTTDWQGGQGVQQVLNQGDQKPSSLFGGI